MNKSAEMSMLEALLASAVDGIITIRADGTIVSANPAAGALFKYGQEEFTGRNVKFLMPEPYQGEHDGYLASYLRSGDKKIIGIGREVQGLRSDGTVFPMHLSVSEYIVDGARFFTGIIHDLSERNQTERALQHALKMDAIGQLTGGIAHDFNNLLTVIIGNLELLEMRIESSAERDLISEAQEAAELGARLTSRLLAFARRSPLEPAAIELNDLTLGLTEILHRTLGETIQLSTSFSTGLWRVMADPTQVETALINLAVNARDAMPDGGMLVMETKNVAIDGAYAATEPGLEPGDYVLLSVTDTGHGMSEDVRSLAIEPFFTTKDKGKGTGLGLSMVYGFAKQSRGHISIYSEANKGTTVNLYLPRHIGLDDEVSGSQTEVEGTARATGELILVVEDDERLRRLTVSRLEELGYRTVEAASGPEALAVLETTRGISLVFSDLVMPGGMSGYDLCTRARQRWPAMRLLLTSGYAEEAVEPGKLADAGVDLLRKPYRLPALADAIRKAIKGS